MWGACGSAPSALSAAVTAWVRCGLGVGMAPLGMIPLSFVLESLEVVALGSRVCGLLIAQSGAELALGVISRF
jgi:hypothetical protein